MYISAADFTFYLVHYMRKVFPLSIELDNNRDTNLLSNMSVVYLLTLWTVSKGGWFYLLATGESETNSKWRSHMFN